MEQLAQVVQIGEVPLAARCSKDPGRDRCVDAQGRDQRGHPLGPQDTGPGLELGLEPGQAEVVGVRGHRGGHGRGVPLLEPRQRDRPRPGGVGRSGQRVDQDPPLLGGGRLGHTAASGDDRRDPRPGQRPLDGWAPAVGVDQDGDVPGLDVPGLDVRPVDPGTAVQEIRDSGDQVVDARAERRVRGPRAGGRVDDAPDIDGRERSTVPSDESTVGVLPRGPDCLVPDAGVAELPPAAQLVHGRQHRTVGTPVGAQREDLGALHGRQVGVDVTAPEGEDGLLGVTHQDQPGVVAVAAGLVGVDGAEDVPLDGVGVLELVDEGDRVLRGQALGRHRDIAEGVAHHLEQPVVGDAARTHQPAADGLGGRADQVGHRPVGVLARAGHDLDPRVVEDGRHPGADLGSGLGLGTAQHHVGEGIRAGRRDQLVGVLDQHGVGVVAADRTQREQHLRAEPVDGGDGRGVEVDDRLGQPVTAPVLYGAVGVQQRPVHDVLGAGPRAGVGQEPGSPDETTPDAVPQLCRRGPREGDDQELVHREALRDEPGGQGGKGERLAGAGRCPEHEATRLRERTVRVELGLHGVGHDGPSGSPATRSVSTMARSTVPQRRSAH